MANIDLRDWLTTNEVAEMLGVGGQRVRDLIRAGRLEAVKAGRDWLVRRKSVDNFERRKPGPKPKKRDSST